jgi:alkylation response protein AidB-like acyl-CoA dehydrogenase
MRYHIVFRRRIVVSRFLSDEQRQIQQTGRAFARREIRPRRLEAYQGHEFITEMAAAVTQECVTLHGGAGYAFETGLEGLHRDAVGGLIIEGTTDMHHSTVAHLLGLPDAAIGIF